MVLALSLITLVGLITNKPLLLEALGVLVFGMIGIFCVMAVIFCSVKVLGSINKKKAKEGAATEEK
jgi:Na+-transporting methylmalonyl-CoA/oxaloacetate decarboxylase gamma subunit